MYTDNITICYRKRAHFKAKRIVYNIVAMEIVCVNKTTLCRLLIYRLFSDKKARYVQWRFKIVVHFDQY